MVFAFGWIGFKLNLGGVGLDFRLGVGQLNFSFDRFWTEMARAELVKAGLGSGLARTGVTAQLGFWENFGDRFGRAWY